jgi:predicted phage tail protein
VTVTRATLIVAGLVYVTLWVIAANGASGLYVPLVVSVALVLMIIGGVALQRYSGIAPRRPKFDDSEDEREP